MSRAWSTMPSAKQEMATSAGFAGTRAGLGAPLVGPRSKGAIQHHDRGDPEGKEERIGRARPDHGGELDWRGRDPRCAPGGAQNRGGDRGDRVADGCEEGEGEEP